MATTYAALSQSGSVVTLMAIALVMLLVMMRDTTAEMVARSETDPLSSVLNRRGFEHHAEMAFLRGGEAAVLVAADLEIGRAHVLTPVTNAQLVCRLLLEKTKIQ